MEMSQLLLTVNGLETWICVKGRVHELGSSLIMVIEDSVSASECMVWYWKEAARCER